MNANAFGHRKEVFNEKMERYLSYNNKLLKKNFFFF